MLRALAIKELRETGLIVLAVLAIYASIVSAATGYQLVPYWGVDSHAIPFVSGSFMGRIGWTSAGLAIALGFRQSMWESVQNTYLFLLHRPAPHWQLIGVKLAVGLGLYLVVASLPVLLFAWWAATPGNHSSPFEWSMTYLSWKVWITTTSVYLASFLCGVREAHWLWSRLWPLAGVGALVFLIPSIPFWPVLGTTSVILLNGVLVAAILLWTQHRDY